MTRIVLDLPAPTSATTGLVSWGGGSTNLGDLSALRATPGTAQLRRLALFALGTLRIQIQVATSTEDGSITGPDLSDTWERSARALTLRVPGLSDLVIAGGGVSGSGDASEPYIWVAAPNTTWLTQFAALPAATRAQTQAIFDDGTTAVPELPAVADQAGNVGTAVDVQLPVATAGAPEPVYAVSGLPRGLAFNAGTRRITGTPTHVETVEVTYTATNSQGAATRTFDFVVGARLVVPALPAVDRQAAYTGSTVDIRLPAVTAGSPAPVYAVAGLPRGLAFDPATRRITGTPTQPVIAQVTYTATNTAGTATRRFEFVITDPPPTAAPVLPPVADQASTVGADVNILLPEVTAGLPRPVYAAAGLPRGLAFDAATRRITGQPTHVETVTVSYTATNDEGTATRRFQFAIGRAVVPPGERYRRAQRALSPVDVTLTALEITHPDVPDPIRAVNDTAQRVIEGETYAPLRFEPRLVDDAEGVPRAELTVVNVGRALTQWVERSGGGTGAQCRVLQVVAGEDVPQYDVTLEVARMSVRNREVHVAIGYEPVFERRAVQLRHDPETSPGIF